MARSGRRHGGNNFLVWQGHVCNNLWGWKKMGDGVAKRNFGNGEGEKFGGCLTIGKLVE